MSVPARPLIAIDELLLLLRNVKTLGAGWQACCPAHEDTSPSLGISIGRTGSILLKCHAGCSFIAICDALRIHASQLCATKLDPTPIPHIVATYDYHDLAGKVIYQAVRFQPKDFRQRQPSVGGGWIWNMKGVTRVPFRWPELVGQSTVWICEGEKDVNALWALGLPATTNCGGAGKWKDAETLALKQIGVTRVIVLPDNDGPGRKHADDIARQMKAQQIAYTSLALTGLPLHGDVSDWLALGHTKADLEELSSKPYVVHQGEHPAPFADRVVAPFGPESWAQSDLGAAEALIHRFGDRLRFDHKQDRWLVWNAHHWRADATKEVRRIAHEHVRAWHQEALQIQEQRLKESVATFTVRMERRASIENMLYEAHAMLPIADDGRTWDKHSWLLGCPNGVIDLKAGQLRAGKRDDFITMQTGHPFNPETPCPRWEQFVNEIFDGDELLIGFIRRAIGYSLTGEMSEQCFFLCIGSGANGKSTFLSTLSGVFGDYAYNTDSRVFAPPSGAAESQSFDLAELSGRRLVLASETKASSRMNEQALKTFTGGEKINAQRKYGHPFEYQPTGKIWMGMNHQPKVSDASFGFWRRVKFLPFNRIFTGSTDNRELKHELAREAPGILAWAVRGCLEWQASGLQEPASVTAATEEYQEREDPIREFWGAKISQSIGDSNHGEPCSRVYKAYKEHCVESGLTDREILGSRAFSTLAAKRATRAHGMAGDRYLGISLIFSEKTWDLRS